jgi:hypothetical protein
MQSVFNFQVGFVTQPARGRECLPQQAIGV